MIEAHSPHISARQIEEGRALFKHQAEFIFGTQVGGKWPRTMFPEVAFVGRSNVGKSTLMNALTGQKNMARVSKTPGRTQQFNFFKLGDRFMLVDMPGYGYAKVGKQLEQMWSVLADEYFKTREQLRRLFVLIDSRHGLKDNDRMLMDWLNRLALPYQVILTKIDKTTAAELAIVKQQVAEELQKNAAALPEMILTSSTTKEGIDTLRAVIAGLRTG